jgi:hypothetical protein
MGQTIPTYPPGSDGFEVRYKEGKISKVIFVHLGPSPSQKNKTWVCTKRHFKTLFLLHLRDHHHQQTLMQFQPRRKHEIWCEQA